MTEQEIAQALGVEMPQENDKGGKEQEIAAPAEGQDQGQPTATAPQGAAEPANPSPAGDAGTGDTAAPSPAGDAGTLSHEGGGLDGAGAEGQEPQTPEERKANAARRRQQETQAAIDAAVAAERARLEQEYQERERQLFADADLKDSISGKPITNREEFYAWRKAYDDARLERNLAAGKLTPEGLDAIIDRSLARAREAQNGAPAKTAGFRGERRSGGASEPWPGGRGEGYGARDDARQAQADQRQRQAEMRARADQEIAEIGKLDPSVKSLQDILAKPTGRTFYEYVQKGNTFLDAYRLANWDELTARQQQTAAQQVQAARQQAAANARSKGHLNPVPTGRGEGANPVPESEMAIYRALLGGEATEAEIKASYNRYMKTRS